MAKQLKTMDVTALLELRGKIDAILSDRRKELEIQLAAFGGGGSVGNGKATSGINVVGNGKLAKSLNGRTGKRAKAAPKYQSKKDRSVKWSGRGMTPIWMRDEMKGTKLKKDDFLIKG
jgi:DNA-binding protein H-NS